MLYGRQFDRYRVPEGKDGGLERTYFMESGRNSWRDDRIELWIISSPVV
jgi:hypothetical protein